MGRRRDGDEYRVRPVAISIDAETYLDQMATPFARNAQISLSFRYVHRRPRRVVQALGARGAAASAEAADIVLWSTTSTACSQALT
jgi:hypothetical protein